MDEFAKEYNESIKYETESESESSEDGEEANEEEKSEASDVLWAEYEEQR